jgi:mono/diheme cytochrome c family protein
MRAVLSRLKGARGRAIAVAATALVAGGSAAGCDTQEDADLERGRALFIENCGSCHALTEARQTATVGPDLDASFAAARESGMDQDTIEGVVQSQIENPRTISEDNPYYDRTFMPAKLVEGRDAEDVAAYVASVAGVPGIEPPAFGTASELFTDQCGTCHTLEAAGSAGVVGPNLDENLPGQSADEILASIVDPSAQVVSGFQPLMPTDYSTLIPEPNLNALVQFLIACTDDPESSACTSAAEQAEADSLEPTRAGSP